MSGKQQPLDLISATTIVAASMIGVGIYTTSGYTLAALGSPERVMWAWAIGAVIAICGSIGYASLAARFTESGGEYLFLARSLHPVAGMMAGWVSLLAGFTGAIALAAIGMEEYLRPMFASGLAVFPEKSLAIAAVLLSGIIHTVGVRKAARVQDAIVVLKLLLIAGFVLYAIQAMGTGRSPTVSGFQADSSSLEPLSMLAFANQLVWISLSFAGFNAAIYIAGEIRDPGRNVPRAMIGGTVLVSVIYLALNAVFLYGASPTEISGQTQVATLAAESIGGSRFASFVGGVIVISLLTSVSAMVMTGPRVYAKMAEDRLFPSWFEFRDRPPILAIWFQAGLAVVAILISSLTMLIGYLGLTLSLCSALTVAMVFVLRFRSDPIRLPLGGVPVALYVVATLVLAVLSALDAPIKAIAAVGTLAMGFVMNPLVRQRKR